MENLFEIAETLSPKLKWLRKHHLTIEIIEGQIRCKHGMDVIARGSDEMEVLVNAATSLNVKLWNEL
jgi:hypothetical protein